MRENNIRVIFICLMILRLFLKCKTLLRTKFNKKTNEIKNMRLIALVYFLSLIINSLLSRLSLV